MKVLGPISGWWWHHHWTCLNYHKWHCSRAFSVVHHPSTENQWFSGIRTQDRAQVEDYADTFTLPVHHHHPNSLLQTAQIVKNPLKYWADFFHCAWEFSSYGMSLPVMIVRQKYEKIWVVWRWKLTRHLKTHTHMHTHIATPTPTHTNTHS